MTLDERVFLRCSKIYNYISLAILFVLFFLILYIQKVFNISINEYTVFIPITVYCILFGIPTLINIYVVLFKPYKKTWKRLRNNKFIRFICSDYFYQELKEDLKYK